MIGPHLIGQLVKHVLKSLNDAPTSLLRQGFQAYRTSIQAGLGCFVLVIFLAPFILHGGAFILGFLLGNVVLCLTVAFWMILRPQPSVLEKILVGAGPLLLLLAVYYLE